MRMDTRCVLLVSAGIVCVCKYDVSSFRYYDAGVYVVVVAWEPG